MRHYAGFIAALIAAGPALAQCRNGWVLPSAQTLSVRSPDERQVVRYVQGQAKPFAMGPDALGLDAAALGRSLSLQAWVVRAEPRWLTKGPMGVATLPMGTEGPCVAPGVYDIAADLDGSLRARGVKLTHASGKAIVQKPGQIYVFLTFATEPAAPSGQTFAYAGMLESLATVPTLAGYTEAGGDGIVSRQAFAAPR